MFLLLGGKQIILKSDMKILRKTRDIFINLKGKGSDMNLLHFLKQLTAEKI